MPPAAMLTDTRNVTGPNARHGSMGRIGLGGTVKLSAVASTDTARTSVPDSRHAFPVASVPVTLATVVNARHGSVGAAFGRFRHAFPGTVARTSRDSRTG